LVFSHQQTELPFDRLLSQGMGQLTCQMRLEKQRSPGDPLASVDEPPTASTVASNLSKVPLISCHEIVMKLFFFLLCSLGFGAGFRACAPGSARSDSRPVVLFELRRSP